MCFLPKICQICVFIVVFLFSGRLCECCNCDSFLSRSACVSACRSPVHSLSSYTSSASCTGTHPTHIHSLLRREEISNKNYLGKNFILQIFTFFSLQFYSFLRFYLMILTYLALGTLRELMCFAVIVKR